MKRIVSYAILLLFVFQTSFSQESSTRNWREMMKDPNVNFYDLQKAFYKEWEGKEVTKGQGYKQFKRYEAFMLPRVYPTGHLPAEAITAELSNLFSQSRGAAAGNWTAMGPTTVPTNGLSYPSAGIGRINCIRFDPQDNNKIWVGSPGGGLWKTTNGGTTWTSNTDNFATLGVSDVAIHPTNSNIMYLATGDFDASDTYSIGVLKSTDGGVTWNTTGFTQPTSSRYRIGRLIINPTSPDILIAATNAGIMRSANAGVTWTTVQTGIFSDIEFKPGDPNTVYAASYANGGNAARMYVSTNGGTSFTLATGTPTSDALRISVAVSPANPAVVYALICNNVAGYKGMYKSTNSGASYTLVNSTPNILSGDEAGANAGGQGWYDLSLAVSPLDINLVYVGGVNAWKSTNGGTSFTITGHWYGGNSGNIPFVHADHHNFEFQPGSSVIFTGNDGGVRKSTNGGSSWTDLSNGLQITQFYRLSIAKSDAEVVYAGAQDNGTNKYTAGAWKSVLGGDGMQPLVDYTNANIVYSAIQYGDIRRSTNAGISYTSIKPSAAPDGAWITPYVLHPTTNTTIFAGYDEIYKSTNSGSTWTALTSGLSSSDLYEVLAIAQSNANVIYAGTPNKLFKTINGGTSWTSIVAGLPTSQAAITSIAVSNTDENKIWVSFSGYVATAKVYYSTNGGTSWTNISTGLPNIPVNTIEYQNGSDNAIYVGTDVGVYYKSNTVAWTSFMTGLPNVKVQDLDIHYATGKIRAATYGRGLWQSDLYGATIVAAPVANFTASSTNITVGQTVNFTDASANTPTSWSWTFTGGSPSSSLLQSPSVTYNLAGTYTVSLVATNSAGSDLETKTSYITVNPAPAPVANFTASATTINVGQTVNFTDASSNSPTVWSWVFTGGTPGVSASQNPSITYNTAGTYSVSLTATNSSGSNTETKTGFITVNPAGSFNCRKWTTQATGFTTANRGIESIEVVNSNVVWAVAYDGSGGGATIRDYTKTTNGGSTWTPSSINVGSANYGLANITAVHADTAWASIYPVTATMTAQGIYKTVNGGTTWTKQSTAFYSSATSFINFVHFFNSNDGVAQGDPAGGYFEIYTTNNGGTTWSRVPSVNIPTPLASDEYGTVGYFTSNGNNIWFTTTKGRIFRSTNKGLNWTAASTPLGLNVTLTNIAFRDANNGFVTGVNPSTQADVGLYKTTDGGATWALSTANTAGITTKSAIEYVPGTTSTYYISGATAGGMGTAYSTDDGATWTSIDNIQHTALGAFNETNVWTGGFNTSSTEGGIFKISFQTTTALINPPSRTSLCAGETILLTANTGTGFLYKWFLNGVEIPGGNGFSLPATAPGVYTVEVTDGTCTALSAAVNITQNPSPNQPIIFGMNAFCAGDTILLKSSPANTYVWYKNSVPIQNAIADSIFISEPGTYKVKITNTFGCEASSTDYLVTQNPLPSKPIITRDSTLLTSTASNFYQWYKNDVEIPFATQQTYRVVETGEYKVLITDINGCQNISDTMSVFVVGVNGELAITNTYVYPNPSTGDYTLSYTLTENTNLKIRVKNILGQVTQEINYADVQSSGTYKIALNESTPGIYFVELNTQSGSKELKLIIQR